jgi:DNA-binding response OmpR family regulator
MHRPEILVVDDDRKTVELVRLYLERAGYGVCLAYDGQQALDLTQTRAFDLVILDLMLPRLDGLDVCHALRTGGLRGSVPIIMLTARVTEDDKLLGLETGADDYVAKPFSPRELVARVNAVLRRVADSRADETRIGDLVIDFSRQEVHVRDHLVRLTPRELALLQTLARQPGRPVSRHGLVERAWGFDYDGLERTVDVHVANLRRKIEPDPAHPVYIKTVPGLGYKLVSELER